MQDEIIQFAMLLGLIALPSVVGAYGKEYLRLMKIAGDGGNYTCVKWVRVILAAATATILIFSASDYLTEKITLKGIIGLSFVAGLIGFELLEQISTLNGLKSLVRDWVDFQRDRGQK